MDLDPENVCRICLAIDRQVISLMKNQPNLSISYLGKLQACVPSLNITESDPYTKNICQKCVPLLDRAFEFHLLCLESDSKLRKPIEKLLIKIETKDEELSDHSPSIPQKNTRNPLREKSTKRRLITKKVKVEQIDLGDDKDTTVQLPKKIKKKSKCFDENGKRIRKKQIPKHECDICGRKVFGKVAMEQHLRIHTGERPFVCEYCGKSFSALNNYRHHLKSHNPIKDKKWKCSSCTYRTSSHQCYKQHMNIHTGKRYACNLCSLTFNRDSTLFNHKKNVHAAAVIPCELCEEKFTTKAKLRRHIICHFREVQYSCPECKNLYASHEGLIYHTKRKHPGIKWPKEKDALVTALTVSLKKEGNKVPPL